MIPSPSRGEGQGWGCSRRHCLIVAGGAASRARRCEGSARTLTQPSPLEEEGS